MQYCEENLVDFQSMLSQFGAKVFWNHLQWTNDENLEDRNEDITAIKFPNGMWVDIGCYDRLHYNVKIVTKDEDWYILGKSGISFTDVSSTVECVKEFANIIQRLTDSGIQFRGDLEDYKI